jgi:DNA modification methylase
LQANRSESIRLLRRCRGLGRLIGAVTKPGDLVVDPAAGGFIVLRAPMALGLVFIGSDIAHHREDQTAA